MAGKFFQALAHIHERGLVHSDLKPGNIFIKAGQPIIFDFNAAAVVPRPGQTTSLHALARSKNFPVGTMVYAAPERLTGTPPNQAADIFSAAATIYEMLSGRHPFSRRAAVDAANEGLVPERLDFLSHRHWRYLEAGLSFDPSKRPSAEELASIYTGGGNNSLSLYTLLLNDLRYLALELYKRVHKKLKFLTKQREVKNGPA
jgi:serine/threonine-protein kinase Stk1